MKKDYTKTAIQGATIILTFSVVSIIIGFILRVLLARTLPTEADLGLLYAVLAFFGLFAIFRDMGLNPALVKYIPEFIVKKDKRRIKASIILTFVIQISMSALILFFILYFSSILSQSFFKTTASIPVIFFVGLSFVSSVLFHLMQAVLQGFQEMKSYALLDPIRSLIVLVVTFLALVLGFGVPGVAFGYFIAALVAGMVGFLFLLRKFTFFKVESNIDRGLVKQMFSFSIPIIGAGMAGVLVTYMDTVMITYFRTLGEVGHYQVALPIADTIGIFAIVMGIVTFPMISELWTRGKRKEISNGLSTMTKFLLVMLAPATLAILIFPETFIGIFGTRYLPALTTLQILVFAMIFKSLSEIYFAALKGIGKIREVATGILILSISAFLINLVLIPSLGIVGAAMSTLIAYTITALFTFNVLRKSIPIKISIHDTSRIFTSIIIAMALGYYMKTNFSMFHNIPWILLCLFVYVVSVIILGVVRKDDIKTIEKSGIRLPLILHKIAR